MKSQSDIAQENQQGIEKANKRQSAETGKTEADRATRFDGNPEQQDAGGTFKPKDDAPLRLKKREFPSK